MISSNKHLKKVIKEAEQVGWVFTRGRKHIKAKRHDRVVSISVTPSDHRAIQNIMKDLGL